MKSIEGEFSRPGKAYVAKLGKELLPVMEKSHSHMFFRSAKCGSAGEERTHLWLHTGVSGAEHGNGSFLLLRDTPDTCSPLCLPFHLTRNTRWDAGWVWCKMPTLILLMAPLRILSSVSEASRQTVQAGLPLLYKRLCSASHFPFDFPRWFV